MRDATVCSISRKSRVFAILTRVRSVRSMHYTDSLSLSYFRLVVMTTHVTSHPSWASPVPMFANPPHPYAARLQGGADASEASKSGEGEAKNLGSMRGALSLALAPHFH